MKGTLAAALQPMIPRRRLIARHGRGTGAVALTFDDGPHPERTPRILDILRAEGVRATFFVVGRAATQHPGLVRAMVDGGHALGNHGFSHRRADGMDLAALGEEIDRTAESIRWAAGASTRLFRPPYGDISLPLVRCAWARALTIVLWSLDSGDSTGMTSGEEVRRRVRAAQAGDILLFHDDSEATPEALGGAIQDLKARGLRFATVEEWVEAA